MTRWHCPLCPPGNELRAVEVERFQVALQRCDRCLGVMADVATAVALKLQFDESHYLMVEGTGRHQCRRCRATFKRDWQRCRHCLAKQDIGCVRCLMPMESVEVAGVALDVCKTCHLVWFDRGELGLLTRRHGSELQRSLLPRAGGALMVAEVLVHGLDAVPLSLELSKAGAEVVVGAVEQVATSGAVEVVAAVGEGAASVTAAAIEILVDLVGGVF